MADAWESVTVLMSAAILDSKSAAAGKVTLYLCQERFFQLVREASNESKYGVSL